jgi:hypothetical protein
MTLPTGGTIAADQINLELGRVGWAEWSMDGSLERLLAGVPAGSYGMDSFYGKSGGRNILIPGALPFSEVGWTAGVGSLTPPQFANYDMITTVKANGGRLIVSCSPFKPAKEYFGSILVNGQRFYTANAQYSVLTKSVQWGWDTNISFAIGQPVFVSVD